MSTRSLIVGVVSAALLALPTLALADGGPPAADNAKAYGKLCQGESKKHVAGERGTPFSRCVTAAAKLREAQDGDE